MWLGSNKPAQVSALPVIAARSNFPSLNRPSSKGPVAVTILTPVYWLHRRGVPYADLGADHFERSDAPGSPEDSPNSASMSPLATKRCDEGLRAKALRASGSRVETRYALIRPPIVNSRQFGHKQRNVR